MGVFYCRYKSELVMKGLPGLNDEVQLRRRSNPLSVNSKGGGQSWNAAYYDDFGSVPLRGQLHQKRFDRDHEKDVQLVQ